VMTLYDKEHALLIEGRHVENRKALCMIRLSIACRTGRLFTVLVRDFSRSIGIRLDLSFKSGACHHTDESLL